MFYGPNTDTALANRNLHNRSPSTLGYWQAPLMQGMEMEFLGNRGMFNHGTPAFTSPAPYPGAQLQGDNQLGIGDIGMNGSSFQPAVTALSAPVLTQAIALHTCTFAACRKSFRRNSDRVRHEQTHLGNRQRFYCPINGCIKGHGAGYLRADKVTEHLWKQHGNLGYTKA